MQRHGHDLIWDVITCELVTICIIVVLEDWHMNGGHVAYERPWITLHCPVLVVESHELKTDEGCRSNQGLHARLRAICPHTIANGTSRLSRVALGSAGRPCPSQDRKVDLGRIGVPPIAD